MGAGGFERDVAIFGRILQLNQQPFINLLWRRAAKLLTVEQDKERIGRCQTVWFAHGRAGKVQQQRTLADAAGANNGNALAVAQQA